MGTTSETEDSKQASPSCSSRCLQSDDVLRQVLQWLSVPQSFRCGRSSKAFSRASLSALQSAGWDAPAARRTCWTYGHLDCTRQDIEGSEESTVLSSGLGTPCLDLRAVGSAVNCGVLQQLLGETFKAPNNGNQTALGPAMLREERERAARPQLKGLAIHSSAVKNKVRAGLNGGDGFAAEAIVRSRIRRTGCRAALPLYVC